MHTRAKKILDFWFKETPLKKRFQRHKDFDALIKNNFLKDYELAGSNEYDDWQDSPLGSLALVIFLINFQEICLEMNQKLLTKIIKQG